MGKPAKSVLIQAFRDADENNNNHLEVNELYILMQKYGDDEIKKEDVDNFLGNHDLDQDGQISYEEYMEFLNKIYQDEEDEE